MEKYSNLETEFVDILKNIRSINHKMQIIDPIHAASRSYLDDRIKNIDGICTYIKQHIETTKNELELMHLRSVAVREMLREQEADQPAERVAMIHTWKDSRIPEGRRPSDYLRKRTAAHGRSLCVPDPE